MISFGDLLGFGDAQHNYHYWLHIKLERLSDVAYTGLAAATGFCAMAFWVLARYPVS